MTAEIAAVARREDPPSVAAALDAAGTRLRALGIEGARRIEKFKRQGDIFQRRHGRHQVE